MTTARIYRPHHVKEHISFQGKLISCSESTTVMLADAVTFGAVRVTQEFIRAHSTEPVPSPLSPGLSIPQCLRVLRNDLHIGGMVDQTGKSWDVLWNNLNDDRRVMLQCYMNELHSCASGKVGHMILLQAYRKGRGVLANDPMCTTAKWYTPQDIKRAAETFADATGVPGAGLRFAVSKVVPRVAVSG